jgi:hypothetical protein
MFRKQTKYSSCQLISAINARIWLGGEDVSEEEYEYLVDLVKCRYGAAIEINKAHQYLGLKTEDGPVDTLDLEWVKTHLPVEIGYPDPQKGFHSALVVEVPGDEVVLLNASWPQKKWADIEFYPHLYNRKLRSFRRDDNAAWNTNADGPRGSPIRRGDQYPTGVSS